MDVQNVGLQKWKAQKMPTGTTCTGPRGASAGDEHDARAGVYIEHGQNEGITTLANWAAALVRRK